MTKSAAWPKSSSVKTVNLMTKSVTVMDIIIFHKRLFFIGAPCSQIQVQVQVYFIIDFNSLHNHDMANPV